MTSKEFAVYLVEPDSSSGSSVIEYNYNGQTIKFTVVAPSENSYESSTVIYLPILEKLNASDALVSTAGAYYAIWEVDSIDDVVYYSSAAPEDDTNSIATSVSFGAAAHKMAKVNLSGNDVLWKSDSSGTAGTNTDTTKAKSDDYKWVGPAVYVTNYPTYELPSTGGLGEILGCLFGGAVILMTVFAWRLHRRRTRGREG
jgi:hypothetical protein